MSKNNQDNSNLGSQNSSCKKVNNRQNYLQTNKQFQQYYGKDFAQKIITNQENLPSQPKFIVQCNPNI